MSAHVAALVVTVDGELQAHKIHELLVFLADQSAVVGGPIQSRIYVSGEALFGLLLLVEDDGSHCRQFGYEVDGIFECRTPLLCLLGARLVSCKYGVFLQQQHSGRQLAHWV